MAARHLQGVAAACGLRFLRRTCPRQLSRGGGPRLQIGRVLSTADASANVYEMLRRATDQLEGRGVPEARLSAVHLLAKAMGVPHTDVFRTSLQVPTDEQRAA